MMRTTIDKMATYIGTKFGDDAAQEWVSNKKTIMPEPTYSQAISPDILRESRPPKTGLSLSSRAWLLKKAAIEAEIQVASSRTLLRELREVDDQIAKCNIKLDDEVEMKLTKDEKTAHANTWRTHREATDSLKKSRAKIYSLLIGQCTQVLVNKMKQDSD
jgi:hypothetical protein